MEVEVGRKSEIEGRKSDAAPGGRLNQIHMQITQESRGLDSQFNGGG